MREIFGGDRILNRILPLHTVQNCEYRLMDYCVVDRFDGDSILFNLVNRKMVVISKTEQDDEKVKQFLIQNGFLVPTGFNEYDYLCNLKSALRKIAHLNRSTIHNFTIFTTTACNANCSYCFERNTDVITMNSETAIRAAKFIANMVGNNQTVYLRWFGGEPLLNTNAINIISDFLKINNIKFTSSIITNATLLEESVVKNAVENWNVDIVQVTLDGTKALHDAIKSVNKGAKYSAFDTTISNIHHLLDSNIRVQIRLNISTENMHDLFDLIDYLDKEFKNKKHLSVYSKILFSKVNGIATDRSQDEERILYDSQYNLNEKIFELGLYKKAPLKSLKPFICAAASEDLITILPNGNLGLCEHKALKECIGTIYTGIVDTSTVEIYFKEQPITSQCKRCPVFPECNRQLLCDAVSNYCLTERQNVMIQEIKLQMRNARREYEAKI